jgi:transposase InsO family protein
MQQYQGTYAISKMARELRVSRSGYYAWLGREPSAREKEDRELLRLIVQIFEENDRNYGSPRIWQELVQEFNKRISRKRVERLMRENGIQAYKPRKFVKTTDSAHDMPVAENILNREFSAGWPGEKWVSDITYLPTANGWLYLTVILDLWDRKVVGWSLSDGLHAGAVCRALMMALLNREPGKGLIFHSDRGVQYCSEDFREALTKGCPEVRQSMSRKGNCWDNACAESFFKTLKREMKILGGRYSKEEVRTAVFRYIEGYYNRRRRHSSLGYATPLALATSKAA